MNKIVAVILTASLAGGAWGAATIPVQSANLFGAMKLTGKPTSLYVAVPFLGFDGAPIAASKVIHAPGLADGTMMHVWNAESELYDEYEVSSGAWTNPSQTVVGDNDESGDVQADLNAGIAAGSGVLLERANTTQSVYVYGQVPDETKKSDTFEEGQTLVSAPATYAGQVNLNAFQWTGVTAARENRKLISGADFIQFRDANNRLIKYYYDGTSWGLQPSYAKLASYAPYVADGQALVPQGTAFWYCTTVGGAKVTWASSGN